MADLSAVRPDIDLINDMQSIIVHYPPTNNDRHHINVNAHNGTIVLSGNTQTPINRKYLNDRGEHIQGALGVDTSQLYDDETIRLDVGRILPPGLIANIYFGNVIIAGELLENVDIPQLVNQIASIPGVRKVLSNR